MPVVRVRIPVGAGDGVFEKRRTRPVDTPLPCPCSAYGSGVVYLPRCTGRRAPPVIGTLGNIGTARRLPALFGLVVVRTASRSTRCLLY